jgi:hypothetical protein
LHICIFYLRLAVTFIFTVKATTVLLPVQVQRFGQAPAIGIALTQVGVGELNPGGSLDGQGDFDEAVMFLPRADEQTRGEGIIAVGAGVFSYIP